jgi:hypothetical protein
MKSASGSLLNPVVFVTVEDPRCGLLLPLYQGAVCFQLKLGQGRMGAARYSAGSHSYVMPSKLQTQDDAQPQ